MEGKSQDMCLIYGMAQELGLSPLEIFKHWIRKGKVKNLVIKVTYDNGEIAELNLSEIKFKTNLNPSKADFPNAAVSQRKKVENFEPPFVDEKPETSIKPETPAKPEETAKKENISDAKPIFKKSLCTTSIKKGEIHIKENQTDNVRVGAYVYTTGDVLPTKELEHTNIRGIILSYTKERITIIRYLGSNMTIIEASKQVGYGWRFLTHQESQKIADYKETLNPKLLETRKKQIDNFSMLLYKDDGGELYAYNAATKKVHKSLNNKYVLKERGFAVFLAKELKLV